MKSVSASLLLLALLLTDAAAGSQYDPLIDNVARNHGIDRFVLRAITQQESKKNPWSFNVDGEGFHFKDKQSAVGALWAISRSPWMAKIVPPKGEGKRIRRFFTSRESAQSFVNGYQRALRAQGKSSLAQRYDDSKEVDYGQGRIRKLWMVNTDIGIAQVNYRFHAKDITSVQRWFDPTFNLNYAATLIAKHKSKYRCTDLTAAGYYHSATPKYRSIYMKDFVPTYQKEVAREGILASSR